MLLELRVENLGVIEDLRLLLGRGLTALTGETGAGKTMLVEALELLVGAKADAALVRPGADEAMIEGRFVVDDDDEVVLARVVPAVGRSRAYVNGRLAPASALAEWGDRLVDLHGQHEHQSLLAPAVQRAALDGFGGIDLTDLVSARRDLARVEAQLSELGGDARSRARELDLLRFQHAELRAAAITDATEDERLSAEEDQLANAQAHQAAAAGAIESLTGEGGAQDAVGVALAGLSGRGPFAEIESRVRDVAAELADSASDLRRLAERIDDDPERLEAVRARRHLLFDLRRKYGETLADVITFTAEVEQRLDELDTHDVRAAELDRERAAAHEQIEAAAAEIGAARRAHGARFARAIEANLVDLAMANATVGVAVGDVDPGDDVAILLAANKGSPQLPLSKVASGGELARSMLALRLVLLGTRDDQGPPTLVFDEVDAGIGGQAATAVGRALAALAERRQVLVVTHLPQVAAFATTQIAVTKHDDGRTTTATASTLADGERVIELSRMLSGSPDSTTAREHAKELLAGARQHHPPGG
ncbi:MAG TPA: DNA repair protein RecN [Acidimicrobiales bacterium]|jgi:DNA repair protein RecN (Recombination protein N)|nr:DNA repair protein RecN [Acidimicrobiales bacterium]